MKMTVTLCLEMWWLIFLRPALIILACSPTAPTSLMHRMGHQIGRSAASHPIQTMPGQNSSAAKTQSSLSSSVHSFPLNLTNNSYETEGYRKDAKVFLASMLWRPAKRTPEVVLEEQNLICTCLLADVGFHLSFGRQGSDRVDSHNRKTRGAHKMIAHVQRHLAAVGLTDCQSVHIHA